MEDVATAVFGLLFVASFALDAIMPRSSWARLVSFCLLALASITVWFRLRLPVGPLVADALLAVSLLCWVTFVAFAAPKWVREMKSAARE